MWNVSLGAIMLLCWVATLRHCFDGFASFSITETRRLKSRLTDMSDYQFFFSYARANYENASWKLGEKSGNYLSDFFEALCKGVNGRTGIPVNQVGYFDRLRLSVSDS